MEQETERLDWSFLLPPGDLHVASSNLQAGPAITWPAPLRPSPLITWTPWRMAPLGALEKTISSWKSHAGLFENCLATVWARTGKKSRGKVMEGRSWNGLVANICCRGPSEFWAPLGMCSLCATTIKLHSVRVRWLG